MVPPPFTITSHGRRTQRLSFICHVTFVSTSHIYFTKYLLDRHMFHRTTYLCKGHIFRQQHICENHTEFNGQHICVKDTHVRRDTQNNMLPARIPNVHV